MHLGPRTQNKTGQERMSSTFDAFLLPTASSATMPRLQILVHKSYHPYLQSNKDKVAKDEKEQKERDQREELRVLQAVRSLLPSSLLIFSSFARPDSPPDPLYSFSRHLCRTPKPVFPSSVAETIPMLLLWTSSFHQLRARAQLPPLPILSTPRRTIGDQNPRGNRGRRMI